MSLYATAEAFAKDTWLPGYINQYENAPGTLYGLMGKQVEKIEGRNTYFKVRVGDSTGGGVIAQGGDFFTPGDITSAEIEVNAAHLSHTIGFDDEELAYLDSGAAAAAPIMQTKMDAAFEAMERQIERMSWMDGTGILARWSSDSTNDMVLSSSATSQIDRDRFIWIDDANRNDYEVVHSTTGASVVAGPLRITNIVESTNTVTFSSSVSAATTSSVVVPYSTGGWASGGAFRSLEFPGLQAAIADGNTYLGINRASAGNGYWQATVVDNSGTLRAISENLVHELVNKIRRRRGDGKAPNKREYMAFASPGSWTAYHNLLSPGLRYTLGEVPDIGWEQPLNMLGIPLYSDIRAPRNGIMVVHKPSFKYIKAKHQGNLSGDLFKFVERGGSMFFQANASSGAAHAAKTYSYLNGFLGMYTPRPRNHGWLKDITEVGSAY